ncbi:conserved hypothetical protein [delta proteobacterium NaphS2]|nr:conserved hypothetical protein [delta proteobacterium NaphS2]
MPEEVKEETQEETQAESTEEAKPVTPEFKKPLKKMTAVELKEVAMEIPGAVGVTAMEKADLIEAIQEYYGLEDEDAGKRKKAKKDKATIKEMKAKIVLLQSKKAEVRETKDAKQINILRKRINRLKKQTRKAVAV